MMPSTTYWLTRDDDSDFIDIWISMPIRLTFGDHRAAWCGSEPHDLVARCTVGTLRAARITIPDDSRQLIRSGPRPC